MNDGARLDPVNGWAPRALPLYRATHRSWWLGVLVALMVMGCGDQKVELVPMTMPDSSAFEPSVRNKLESVKAKLDQISATKPSNEVLGRAYGELAMAFHAQDLVQPAERAYANARKLAPKEIRWPYLQGHLFNDASRVPEALEAFEAARAIQPKDLPTLVSLGQSYLQMGKLEPAQKAYEEANQVKAGEATAQAGLAKLAMIRKDYPKAIEHFEQAIKLWPNALHLYQPLAIAYRGSGDAAKAEQSLARFDPRGVDPSVSDPAADALAAEVVASKVLLRRGQREGKVGRFDLAEVAFRAATVADPSNAEAFANLGISLANLGRIAEAQQVLVRSLEMDDSIALANLSLAVLFDRQGQDGPAEKAYSAAIRLDLENTQACVYLGDLYMRTGRVQQAIDRYAQASSRSPGSPRVQISQALALIKAGRFSDARKTLEPLVDGPTPSGEAMNLLARILATSTEASLRNGPRALILSQTLFQKAPSPNVGQTLAMALAETGDFEAAKTLQSQTIAYYERTKVPVDLEFLKRNLDRFVHGRAAREGWSPSDPIFSPRSPAAALTKESAAS